MKVYKVNTKFDDGMQERIYCDIFKSEEDLNYFLKGCYEIFDYKVASIQLVEINTVKEHITISELEEMYGITIDIDKLIMEGQQND